MTEMILTIVISVVGSGGLWSVVQWWLTTKHTKETASDKALKALLHDRLYQGCTDILDRGEVSVEEYDNLKYLYLPYRELGGNGTCEKLMHEVDTMRLHK